MKEKNITVRSLANDLDMHHNQLYQILRGGVDPSFTTMCDIAKRLRTSINKLAEGFPGRLKKRVHVPAIGDRPAGARYICYIGTPDVPNDASAKERTEIACKGFTAMWLKEQKDKINSAKSCSNDSSCYIDQQTKTQSTNPRSSSQEKEIGSDDDE